MTENKNKLQIIIPIYNEEECLPDLIKRLLALIEKQNQINLITEVIFVNDGSSDNSFQMLIDYANKYAFFKLIDLSRNFGHQFAITAGLDRADADYVAIIDGDLQDPPELIEDMYKKALEGFDVVYAQRHFRKQESFFKILTAKMFYRLISAVCDIKLPVDTGDFRLINKNVLKVLQSMRERHRFIRGMVPWIGFKSTPIFYDRDKRFAGTTKFSTHKMLLFALDAIFSFSNTPLRIAIISGLFICFLGFLGLLSIVYLRLFTSYYISGIPAVIVTVIILGGFQIVMLGVVGEYIGRIFEESKKRPLYIIRDTFNF